MQHSKKNARLVWATCERLTILKYLLKINKNNNRSLVRQDIERKHTWNTCLLYLLFMSIGRRHGNGVYRLHLSLQRFN